MYPKIDDQRYEKRALRKRVKELLEQLKSWMVELDACGDAMPSDIAMAYFKLQDAAKAIGIRGYELMRVAEKLGEIAKAKESATH